MPYLWFSVIHFCSRPRICRNEIIMMTLFCVSFNQMTECHFIHGKLELKKHGYYSDIILFFFLHFWFDVHLVFKNMIIFCAALPNFIEADPWKRNEFGYQPPWNRSFMSEIFRFQHERGFNGKLIISILMPSFIYFLLFRQYDLRCVLSLHRLFRMIIKVVLAQYNYQSWSTELLVLRPIDWKAPWTADLLRTNMLH